MNDFVPHELPWFPVVQTFPVANEHVIYCLTQAEVLAIRAMKAGNANSFQQQMALNAIVKKIGGTHDMTFRPGEDGDRATAFAEGRRFVGLMLARAIAMLFQPSGDSHAPRTSTTPSDPPIPTSRRNTKPPARRTKPGTRDPGSESANS